MFELNHLIKDPTCSNHSCIDNFYTNKNKMFFNSSTVKTSISDHHSLICTMFCSTFCKGTSKFIYYRSYNNYKMKKIRYNHQVFMNKTLRKAIMKRSKLRNTFNKKRSSENWRSYKRQRNICSNILKSTKKTFFEALNINEITDNRKFRKTVKPFFTDKCKTTDSIILTEKKWNSQWQQKDFQHL